MTGASCIDCLKTGSVPQASSGRSEKGLLVPLPALDRPRASCFARRPPSPPRCPLDDESGRFACFKDEPRALM
jgi:hypothetical protein